MKLMIFSSRLNEDETGIPGSMAGRDIKLVRNDGWAAMMQTDGHELIPIA